MRSLVVAGVFCLLGTVSTFGEIKQGIVYAERNGQKLMLDIAVPESEGKMRPAIMCIHGGGWKEGKRQSYHAQLEQMSKRGYVVATVDYRLTGVAPWPAQIVDVRDALQLSLIHI